MNTMHCEGYVALIEFDESVDLFHGRVLGLRDVVEFYGKDVDGLKKEFKASLEEYLDMCREEKIVPEKPFPGKFTIRTDSEHHRRFSLAASMRNMSLNSWVNEVLDKAVKNL